MTSSRHARRPLPRSRGCDGLLDVAYDVLTDTPVGTLLVGVYGSRRSAAIRFDPEPEQQLERSRAASARACSARPSAVDAPRASSTSTSRAGATRSTSSSTCAARRTSTGACSPSSRASSTARRRRTARSPRRSGNPKAARAVGTVMNRNPIPIVLPCHRVVGAIGSLTGYGGGLDRKEHCSGSRARSLRVDGRFSRRHRPQLVAHSPAFTTQSSRPAAASLQRIRERATRPSASARSPDSPRRRGAGARG